MRWGDGGFERMFFEGAYVRTQLKEMFAGSHAFQPVEVDHVFPGEGQRTLILDARPLSFPGHSERRVLVTFRDITARKQAEAVNDLRAIAERRGGVGGRGAVFPRAQRPAFARALSSRG